MSRSRIAILLSACLAIGGTHAIRADVRSEQKTRFQLAGALGRVVNIFGGRAAREGVIETVAVKGNRKMRTAGDTGQIIDLTEEKIYDLDFKKKSYTVTTFADIRRQMEEARKRAAEDARKAQRQEQAKPAEPDPNAKEIEIDLDVKNTGQRKPVNGFETQQTVMTITVREKGKTLEQAGGLLVTSDMWLTQSIGALKEVQAFDLKYAQKLYGPMITGASPQDMASVMAMYPMMKPAMEKLAAEASKIRGTPVLTITTMEAVKSAAQMAEEEKAGGGSAGSGGGTPTSVGGLIGGFGRRMARRNSDKNEETAAAGPKNRVTVFTTTSETLKVATTVTAEDVSIPAGFRESK